MTYHLPPHPVDHAPPSSSRVAPPSVVAKPKAKKAGWIEWKGRKNGRRYAHRRWYKKKVGDKWIKENRYRLKSIPPIDEEEYVRKYKKR